MDYNCGLMSDFDVYGYMISLLLTSDIKDINSKELAGTEFVFLHDIALLKNTGHAIVASARFSDPQHSIKRIRFPESLYAYALPLGRQIPFLLNFVRSIFQIVYMVRWYRTVNTSESLVLYGMPIGSVIDPKKTVLFIHYERYLPFWLLLSNRYKQTRYIFCSTYMRDAFLHRYRTLTIRQCAVIPNAVDPSVFYPPKHSAPRKRGISLLYASAWAEEKGMHIMLQAICSLPKDIQDQILLTIASGPNLWHIDDEPQRMQYIRQVRELIKRIPHATVLNGVDKNGLARLYRSADWLVFPSIWEEPFGMCALEAIACGTPVAGFKSGGLPEILSPTNSLLLEEKNMDALAQAFADIISKKIKPKKRQHSLFTEKNSLMIDSYRNALFLKTLDGFFKKSDL